MMNCLYFLLFVAACQAYRYRERTDDEDIPAPNLIRVELVEDPSLALKVEWKPLLTSEDSEPSVTYKVVHTGHEIQNQLGTKTVQIKVWEQEKGNTYRYKTTNGVERLVEDNAPTRFQNRDESCTHKLRDVIVYGADRTSAKVDGIEEGVTYEARVQAFTRNGDGPLSDPIRIKVSSRDYDRQRDVYTED